MALFSRRPKSPATAPDLSFSYWDLATAAEFRALVRTAFAEAGSEVTVFADHVVDSRGTQYGLANLAAMCHNDERGRRAWPEVVSRHVHTVTAGMGEPSPFDVMSDSEVLASTYCRLMPTADVLPTMAYTWEIAAGLSVAFNLDLPETVAYFTDEHVARFGLETLENAGRTNLRRIAIDDRQELEHGGGRIQVWMGESLFTASLLLEFEDLLHRSSVTSEPHVGAFVALPYRHQLDFHIPRDATAIPSLQTLAGFAAAGFADSAGPVSPSVYWWRSHTIERISTVHDDGIQVHAGPELTDVLNEIAGR